MPEVQFKIVWPDGESEVCYSPSSVVQTYFGAGESYDLEEFVARSRQALKTASDRVQQKYGHPCRLALTQLQAIEEKANHYPNHPRQQVKVLYLKVI